MINIYPLNGTKYCIKLFVKYKFCIFNKYAMMIDSKETLQRFVFSRYVRYRSMFIKVINLKLMKTRKRKRFAK